MLTNDEKSFVYKNLKVIEIIWSDPVGEIGKTVLARQWHKIIQRRLLPLSWCIRVDFLISNCSANNLDRNIRYQFLHSFVIIFRLHKNFFSPSTAHIAYRDASIYILKRHYYFFWWSVVSFFSGKNGILTNSLVLSSSLHFLTISAASEK